MTSTRNDDYAGGIAKLVWGIRYLAEQCHEFNLPAEVVIVEWNPPADRPGLAQAIGTLPPSTHVSVRNVVVPASWHARYRHHDKRPLHSGVAANVGIRRARGAFIMGKAADVYYPDRLVEQLARGELRAGALYRVERRDVDPEAASRLGTARGKFLSFCRDHVSLRNRRLPQPWMPFELPDLFTNACGDFQLMAREHWWALRGYVETRDVTSLAVDSMMSYAAFGRGIREEVLNGDLCVYKIAHGQSHGFRTSTGTDRYSGSLTAFERQFRDRLDSTGYRHLGGFVLHALFNYPATISSGIRKRSNERTLMLFKLLSAAPRSILPKNRDWGLARARLAESFLARADWDR